ncbi:MAG: ABC transporter permease [Nitrospina sp.]|jgi:peptide/nickel transport system permease protein|nr:ABC transporter permease [Nitrospina sp.]
MKGFPILQDEVLVIRFLARRLFLTFFLLGCLSIIVFFAIRAIPGDMVQVMLGPGANEAAITALRKSYGLDKPLIIQYSIWLVKVLQGDMGESLRMGKPVLEEILTRFPVTLELITMAMGIALLIAFPFGVICAVKQNTWVDHLLRPISIFGLSIPDFWWAVMFIIIISNYLPQFYVFGYASMFEDLGMNLKAVLPAAISLGIVEAAVTMRFIRSSLVEVLKADYITTARAKGLTETVTIGKHAIRNSLIDVITVIGLQMGALLSGAVLVEIVFGLPGLGRMTLDAVFQRDYPMVQGSVLFIAGFFILINLLVDILYSVLDPRIRVS